MRKMKKKLLFHSASRLSDEELLTIALGSVKAASELLKRYGNSLKAIHQAPAQELVHIDGMGLERIYRLKAYTEICRRIHFEKLQRGRQLKAPSVVFEVVWPILSSETREVFLLLPLDAKNKLICSPIPVSIGSDDSSIVKPRQVAEYLISHRAVGCIGAHNHPSSGNCEPSKQDTELCRILRELCDLMGVRMLDFLVVGDNTWYSFVEKHRLPVYQAAEGRCGYGNNS